MATLFVWSPVNIPAKNAYSRIIHANTVHSEVHSEVHLEVHLEVHSDMHSEALLDMK